MADDATVTDNESRRRFEITADGEVAGFAEYELAGDVITFTHTVVDERFEGRGLGGTLAKAALDTARQQRLTVVPRCSFIRETIRRNPDYLDIVDAGWRDKVGGD